MTDISDYNSDFRISIDTNVTSKSLCEQCRFTSDFCLGNKVYFSYWNLITNNDSNWKTPVDSIFTNSFR